MLVFRSFSGKSIPFSNCPSAKYTLDTFARISNVDGVMFVNRIRDLVSFELGKEIEKDIFLLVTSEGKRITSESPWGIEPQTFGFCDHLGLCGSVVGHPSAESESLRFDSSWGLRIFSFSHARDITKNIFLYFFTEHKTYHLSYSGSFSLAKYAQF